MEDGGTTAGLVLAARGGDAAAVRVLYTRFARVVHGVLLGYVQHADAEDLTQDVFQTALQRLAELREPAAFPGWLLRIARNAALNRVRQPQGDSVRQLVALSRREDAITLLSLLSRYPQLRDGPIFDRLTRLVPAGVTREALAAQGADALNPWWDALPYPPMKRWWIQWPDAISATGNARSHLRYDPP